MNTIYTNVIKMKKLFVYLRTYYYCIVYVVRIIITYVLLLRVYTRQYQELLVQIEKIFLCWITHLPRKGMSVTREAIFFLKLPRVKHRTGGTASYL